MNRERDGGREPRKEPVDRPTSDRARDGKAEEPLRFGPEREPQEDAPKGGRPDWKKASARKVRETTAPAEPERRGDGQHPPEQAAPVLRDALTASYFVAVWKMLRKKGCVPSALTQNVKDLLASREIEAILDNTDFMILLSQAQSDRAILAKQIGISEHQLSYITHANSGEGLLFYGSTTIPFVDRFPKGEIYNLLTTRPEDLRNEPGA